MNIIHLICIYVVLLSSNIIASIDVDIEKLQKNFYIKVLKTNIYKKRFNSYLNKKCPNDSSKCYEYHINYLSSWDTVQEDLVLNNMITSSVKTRVIDNIYWDKIQNILYNKKDIFLDKSQFVSLIDLSKQLYVLTIWHENTRTFSYIGSDLISSGDMSKESTIQYGEDHYFNSPTGIFKVQSGWRSEGKILQDNYTLPYGKKGRYIYYLGKQNSVRYNTFDKNGKKILLPNEWNIITDKLEFAMHAHRSYFPLGSRASHGCIRMSNDLNIFIDNNYVLHKSIVNNDKWLNKFASSPKEPNLNELAGEYIFILDKI